MLYLTRVSLTVSCSMQLRLFPFDEQTCHLYVASCRIVVIFYTRAWWCNIKMDGPRLIWSMFGMRTIHYNSHPTWVCLADSSYGCLDMITVMLQYLGSVAVDTLLSGDVKTNTGEYSCLQVDLVFIRQLSYYMVTMYVPCTMIVVVSWFAFWIDHKSVRRLK